MAKQPDIWYINASVCGSSAYQIQAKPEGNRPVRLPKQKRAQKKLIAIDPVAFLSICVAGLLLVLLVAGFMSFHNTNNDVVAMNRYVQSLQEENQQLKDTYASGYDGEQIRDFAIAMGKVPASEVMEYTVSVQVPAQQSQPTAWESFFAFLTGLFA